MTDPNVTPSWYLIEEEEPREKTGPQEDTCPEWMMTMGDCMSLLLTFFVLFFEQCKSQRAFFLTVKSKANLIYSCVNILQNQ